jgi:ammonia channel protein AmtB
MMAPVVSDRSVLLLLLLLLVVVVVDLQNLLDLSVAGIAFFFFGYGIAFGTVNKESSASLVFGFDTPFSIIAAEPARGYGHLFYMVCVICSLENDKVSNCKVCHYFGLLITQFGFCVTSSTILAGGLNERTIMPGYLWMTFVLSLFVQPTVMHCM